MNPHILLIEDDPGLRLTITDLLQQENYTVESASDGDKGLASALDGRFDAIVLDVMLPRRNGFEICRELRKRGNGAAILMLTARGQVSDRVAGLKLGADDYLVKPFDPSELLARLEALLRRTRREKGPTFRFGNVEADFDNAEVRKDGQPVNLAGKELDLLRYLIEHRGRVVLRDELMTHVWGYASDASSRTIDTHVGWLRQKLEDDPQSPRYIRTIWGKGYRFSID